MQKIIVDPNRVNFIPSEKRLIALDYDSEIFNGAGLFTITNVTDNTIIYSFACEGFGGVFDENSLILEYDTTSMSKTDVLQIIYYVNYLLQHDQ